MHQHGNSKLTAEEVLECMKAVAQSNFNDYRTDGETRRTQWTLVFDQKALTRSSIAGRTGSGPIL